MYKTHRFFTLIAEILCNGTTVSRLRPGCPELRRIKDGMTVWRYARKNRRIGEQNRRLEETLCHHHPQPVIRNPV
jgi:hypothetical protein